MFSIVSMDTSLSDPGEPKMDLGKKCPSLATIMSAVSTLHFSIQTNQGTQIAVGAKWPNQEMASINSIVWTSDRG